MIEDIVVFGQCVGEVSCMLIHLALLYWVYINNYKYMLQTWIIPWNYWFRTFHFGIMSCPPYLVHLNRKPRDDQALIQSLSLQALVEARADVNCRDDQGSWLVGWLDFLDFFESCTRLPKAERPKWNHPRAGESPVFSFLKRAIFQVKHVEHQKTWRSTWPMTETL